MKTKIFVCSNSGIDYIKHSPNIDSIPIIYVFNNGEEYIDYVNLTADAFYNRKRFDNLISVDYASAQYHYVNEKVKGAIAEGYDQILFLLSSKHYSNLFVTASIVLAENKEVKSAIYDSNLFAYPLAYMAMKANELCEKQVGLNEVLDRLEILKKNQNIYIFEPTKNDDYSKNFEKYFRYGRCYSIFNGRVVRMNIPTKDSLVKVFGEYSRQIDGMEVCPFVLTTDLNSRYVNILINGILDIDPTKANTKNYKKIPVCFIPPTVGMELGDNLVGIGYVIDDNLLN